MGAAKGTFKADQTVFRKKGTGNPVLINKKDGKFHLTQIAFNLGMTVVSDDPHELHIRTSLNNFWL